MNAQESAALWISLQLHHPARRFHSTQPRCQPSQFSQSNYTLPVESPVKSHPSLSVRVCRIGGQDGEPSVDRQLSQISQSNHTLAVKSPVKSCGGSDGEGEAEWKRWWYAVATTTITTIIIIIIIISSNITTITLSTNCERVWTRAGDRVTHRYLRMLW